MAFASGSINFTDRPSAGSSIVIADGSATGVFDRLTFEFVDYNDLPSLGDSRIPIPIEYATATHETGSTLVLRGNGNSATDASNDWQTIFSHGGTNPLCIIFTDHLQTTLTIDLVDTSSFSDPITTPTSSKTAYGNRARRNAEGKYSLGTDFTYAQEVYYNVGLILQDAIERGEFTGGVGFMDGASQTGTVVDGVSFGNIDSLEYRSAATGSEGHPISIRVATTGSSWTDLGSDYPYHVSWTAQYYNNNSYTISKLSHSAPVFGQRTALKTSGKAAGDNVNTVQIASYLNNVINNLPWGITSRVTGSGLTLSNDTEGADGNVAITGSGTTNTAISGLSQGAASGAGMAANRLTEYGRYMVMERVSGSNSPTTGKEGEKIVPSDAGTVSYANAGFMFYSGSSEANSKFYSVMGSGSVAVEVVHQLDTFTGSVVLPGAEKIEFNGAGSGEQLYSSAGGQMDLDADTLIELTAPTIELAGATKVDIQSDAVHFGEGGAADVALTFNTDGNDGVITWTDSGDEDYFLFSDDIFIAADEKIQLGDAGEYISGDGTDLKIVSSNDIDVTGDMNVVGEVTSTKLTTLASAEGVTTIGSSNAAVFTAAGILNINSTTNATSTTDGSLQTDGGLSVALDAVIGDDLFLLSDSAVLSLGAGSDATLTHDGTTGVTLAANPITLDSAGAITLDADNGSLIFADGGTEIGRLQNVGDSNLIISSSVADKDIIFAGNDGGSKLTALTLDMSDGGKASFASTVTAVGSFIIGSADMSEADLEKLDGITNGTAAASKAIVLDADLSIGTINNLTASYIKTDHIQAGVLDVNVINSISVTNSTLEIEDKTIIAASGSASAAADGGGLQIGGSNGSDSVASVTYTHSGTKLNHNIAGNTIVFTDADGLHPVSDSDGDLGASGAAWANLYVDAIDLNGQGSISMGGTGRIDLDADDDTSIRAIADDVIAFEIGGTDRLLLSASNMSPNTSDGYGLGDAENHWSDLFLASGAVVNFNAGDVTMTHASNLMTIAGGNTRVDRLEIDSANDYIDVDTDLKLVAAADIVLDPAGSDVKVDGNVVPNADDGGSLGSANLNWSDLFLADGAVLSMGDDQEVSLTHVADTGMAMLANTKFGLNGSANIATSYLNCDGGGGVTLSAQHGSASPKISLISTGPVILKPATGDEIQLGAAGTDRDVLMYGSGNSYEYLKWDSGDATLSFTEDQSSAAVAFLTLGGDSSAEFAIDVAQATTNRGKIRATSFVTYSDETLKTNITPMDDALGSVMKLQGVTFDWKNSGEADFGFIAQDIKKIIPQAVSDHGDNGVMGVDYSRLTAVLVEAMKAQQSEIETLKSAIAKLSK